MNMKLAGIKSRIVHYFVRLPQNFRRLFWLLLHPFQPKIRRSNQSKFRPIDYIFEFIFCLLDILGVPEVYETIFDLVKCDTRQLDEVETGWAHKIYGNSINYSRIRIDENARLGPKQFSFAYASFYTINSYGKLPIAILMHELMHVWQFEKYGSVYVYYALLAQKSSEGYDYHGIAGLRKQELLENFNFEQMGDIVSDYCRLIQGLPPQWSRASIVELYHYTPYIDSLKST